MSSVGRIRTLVIIKPDAVKKGVSGKIIARFEEEGFTVEAIRMVRLSERQAQGFYYVHRERPFFGSLTAFMTSGPCIPMVLSGGEDTISRVRAVMGATNPAEAAEGTLRKLFAANIEQNAVHGSDSPESAAFEIPYFFQGVDLA